MKKGSSFKTLSDRETPQPLKSLLSHSKYFFFGETTHLVPQSYYKFCCSQNINEKISEKVCYPTFKFPRLPPPIKLIIDIFMEMGINIFMEMRINIFMEMSLKTF